MKGENQGEDSMNVNVNNTVAKTTKLVQYEDEIERAYNIELWLIMCEIKKKDLMKMLGLSIYEYRLFMAGKMPEKIEEFNKIIKDIPKQIKRQNKKIKKLKKGLLDKNMKISELAKQANMHADKIYKMVDDGLVERDRVKEREIEEILGVKIFH